MGKPNTTAHNNTCPKLALVLHLISFLSIKHKNWITFCQMVIHLVNTFNKRFTKKPDEETQIEYADN